MSYRNQKCIIARVYEGRIYFSFFINLYSVVLLYFAVKLVHHRCQKCNVSSTVMLQMEVKRLQEHNQMLSRELEIEKEKLHSLEAALDGIKSQGKKILSNIL